MENLVDDVIYIDYDELKNVKLIMNKRFGLVVYKDNVKYEFLLNLLDSSDKLIILGSGALGRNNNKFDRTKPIFSRWSWSLPESMINYNDPTLYIHDDIVSPWGIGTEDNWYLKNISLIIKTISKKLNVSNDKIIFSGSSAGGFTSLLLSILIRGSVAYVEIPQFNVTYWKDYFDDILEYCFDKPKSEVIKKWGHRLSFTQLIIKEKYVPNAYIFLDCSSKYDFENQYMPFFEDLNKIEYDDSFNKLKLMIYGQNRGHDHFSIDVYKDMLNDIICDIDLKESMKFIGCGFHIIDSNNFQTTFSNGQDRVTLFSFQNKSVSELVDEYVDLKTNNEQTVEKDILKLSGEKVIVTKLNIKNLTYINYWFERNKNSYQYHFNPINGDYDLSKLNKSISCLIRLINQY